MHSIGLDIGAHSIKLVGLRQTPKGVFLTSFAVKELPLEARGEKRDAGVIAEKIKELLHEENIKPRGIEKLIQRGRSRKVTIGVSGPPVVIRRIRLPSMPKKELKKAVRWEARKFIPFPLEKAIIDFQLLGEVVEEGAKKLDLMVAAAEAEFIESQLAIIKKAGLGPVGIGAIPHALWHSMQRIPEAREGVTALIDIGDTKTSINIVRDNRLQFTRDITIAGNAFTEAIKEGATMAGAALDFTGAEEIKKEYGIPREEEIERTKGQVPLRKISFAMRPILERLLTEINRSFEFYEGQYKGEEKVGRIFISGGGASLKGLKEYLTDQLGTPVELLIPFKGLAPTLAIATGLALGKAKEINLLPEEYKPAPWVLMQKYGPVALACLVFFVLLGVYLKTNVACTRHRKELALKKAQLAGLQSANIRIVQLEETRKILDQQKAFFPEVALEQPPWEEILKEISHIVPEKATLTGLFLLTKETAKELRLKGVTFGGDAEIVGSIVEIMEGLEKSSFFSHVRLYSSEENDEYSEPGANFDIRCSVLDTRY